MERFILRRWIAVTLISCCAYGSLLHLIFGCTGFVAVHESNHNNVQVLFQYSLFRRQRKITNDQQEEDSTLLSCQIWTPESIVWGTDQDDQLFTRHDRGAETLQRVQLGQAAATIGVVAATMHLLLLASNLCLRLPNLIMIYLGGSLCMIVLLLLAAMMPSAVSFPFCNRQSAANEEIVRCHPNNTLFYPMALSWMLAGVGVTFLGDTNVDRILHRRRNEIEAVSENHIKTLMLTGDMDDDFLEEGTSAPTIDDILMLGGCEDNNYESAPLPIGHIPDAALAECVRSLQLPTASDNTTALNHDDDANQKTTRPREMGHDSSNSMD